MSKKKSWQKIDPSNSTITNFFQSQKKTTLIEPLQNKTEGFYDDFSANQCTSECLKQKRDLKRILESETEKLNDLKQALSTCLKICEKKNSKSSICRSKLVQASPSKRKLPPVNP